MKIYCGIDWAEAHHDVAVVDDAGTRLAKARITDDLAGFTALCGLLADTVAVGTPHKLTEDELTEAGVALEPDEAAGFVPVDVAIETDRGLLVAALRAAGHRVWSINPKAAGRYRDRYASSRAKSDPGDALIPANVLRTDAHAHRQLPADSHLAAAVGVLARTQQDLVRRRRSEAPRSAACCASSSQRPCTRSRTSRRPPLCSSCPPHPHREQPPRSPPTSSSSC